MEIETPEQVANRLTHSIGDLREQSTFRANIGDMTPERFASEVAHLLTTRLSPTATMVVIPTSDAVGGKPQEFLCYAGTWSGSEPGPDHSRRN